MKRVVNSVLAATMITALYCIPAMAEDVSPHSFGGMAAIGTEYY